MLNANSIFIQNFCQAISAILGLDVTIVDKHLVRIAATGIYKNSVETKISHGYFYEKIMKQKKSGMIENIKDDPNCAACAKKHNCIETACLSYPIINDGESIGLISIVTFDNKQKERLLKDKNKLENFLQYMCLLLRSKLTESQNNVYLKNQISQILSEREIDFDDISSQNNHMKQIIELCKKVAPTNSHILIQGESGTGKRTFAKAIHKKSSRFSNIPITMDCRYIKCEQTSMQKSSDYMHDFWSSIYQSNNSTLILEEICSLPLDIQISLIDIFKKKFIKKDDSMVPINIRCISTTSKNLEEMVQKGTFHEELYYLICVIPITIPPLHERVEDIITLSNYFIKLYECEFNKNNITISEKAMNSMMRYPWKGNIRELKNMLEYLVNINESGKIDFFDLPVNFQTQGHNNVNYDTPINKMLEEYEKNLYKKYFGDNCSLEDKEIIAQKLGISIATAYRKLKKYNLN